MKAREMTGIFPYTPDSFEIISKYFLFGFHMLDSRVMPGITMSAPGRKRPDVQLAARYIGGTVSASRRTRQVQDFTQVFLDLSIQIYSELPVRRALLFFFAFSFLNLQRVK